jgi:hypothetical protein
MSAVKKAGRLYSVLSPAVKINVSKSKCILGSNETCQPILPLHGGMTVSMLLHLPGLTAEKSCSDQRMGANQQNEVILSHRVTSSAPSSPLPPPSPSPNHHKYHHHHHNRHHISTIVITVLSAPGRDKLAQQELIDSSGSRNR